MLSETSLTVGVLRILMLFLLDNIKLGRENSQCLDDVSAKLQRSADLSRESSKAFEVCGLSK